MASSAPPIAAPQDPTSEEDAEYGSSQSSIDDTISVDLVPRLAPSSTPSACFSIWLPIVWLRQMNGLGLANMGKIGILSYI